MSQANLSDAEMALHGILLDFCEPAAAPIHDSARARFMSTPQPTKQQLAAGLEDFIAWLESMLPPDAGAGS